MEPIRIAIPRVSTEFYAHLCKIFTPKVITPVMAYEDILYQAGQQSVLSYIERTVSGLIPNDTTIVEVKSSTSKLSIKDKIYSIVSILRK